MPVSPYFKPKINITIKIEKTKKLEDEIHKPSLNSYKINVNRLPL